MTEYLIKIVYSALIKADDEEEAKDKAKEILEGRMIRLVRLSSIEVLNEIQNREEEQELQTEEEELAYVCKPCGYRFEGEPEADQMAVSGCPDCGGIYVKSSSVKGKNVHRGQKR
jgi:rubrerythrin